MSTSSSLKATSQNYIWPESPSVKYRRPHPHDIDMRTNRSRAVVALATAGAAWGASVPLSKVGMGWLGPGWLTTVRFALAAVVLLMFVPRQDLRAAFSWRVVVWGALGYGGSVLVQNAGLAHTSVTHTALIIGAGPVLIALIAAL